MSQTCFPCFTNNKYVCSSCYPTVMIKIKNKREGGSGGGQGTETCTSVPERSRPISAVAVAPEGVDSLSERKSQKPGKLLLKDKVGTEGLPENMTDLYYFFFLSRIWSFPHSILSICLSLLSLRHPRTRISVLWP